MEKSDPKLLEPDLPGAVSDACASAGLAREREGEPRSPGARRRLDLLLACAGSCERRLRRRRRACVALWCKGGAARSGTSDPELVVSFCSDMWDELLPCMSTFGVVLILRSFGVQTNSANRRLRKFRQSVARAQESRRACALETILATRRKLVSSRVCVS